MSTQTLLHKLCDASPIRHALLNLEAWGIEILDFRDALVRCPGQDLHTTKNGDRDCKVLGHPTGPRLKCFHRSCWEVVGEFNALLRHGVTDPSPLIGHTSGRLVSPHNTAPNQYRIDQVIKDHPWDYRAIELACPEQTFQWDIQYHAVGLLTLFEPTDIVWIGDLGDSGKLHHAWNFRQAQDWIKNIAAPSNYICPSTFHSGEICRCNSKVKDRRFLIVESDILDRDEVGSVFQWMIAQNHRLRAIVDTAGKSLHAWFDFPEVNLLSHLKHDLAELGCDPAMFAACQAGRLPGAIRDGKYQKLIYINA